MKPARAITASIAAVSLAGASLLIATPAAASEPDDTMIVVEYEGSRVFVGDPNEPGSLQLLVESPDLPENILAGDIDSTGTVYLLSDSEDVCTLSVLDLDTGAVTNHITVTIPDEGPPEEVVRCSGGFDIDEFDVAWLTLELTSEEESEGPFAMTIVVSLDLETGMTEFAGVLVIEEEPGEGDLPEDLFVTDVEAIAVSGGTLIAVTEAGTVYSYTIDLDVDESSPFWVAESRTDMAMESGSTWAADFRGDDLWVLSYDSMTNESWHVVGESFASSGVLEFEGEEVDLGALFFAPDPAPRITLSTSTAAQGETITVNGQGFPEGEVDLELHSLPMSLGTVTASASGTFSTSVTIPATAPAGAHSVVALVDGGSLASAAITITAVLPATGVETDAAVAFGALLLLLGAAAVAATRVRRV